MNENIKICIDKVLPEEKRKEARELAIKENPDNAEMNENNGNELALVIGKKWANGRILRVRFLGGDINIQRKVEEYAHKWEEFANIKFVFGNYSNAEIRISLVPDNRSWSYIGTDCLTIRNQNEATMNYGWFNANTSNEEYSRTVIHEFGHALGLVHEHQSPSADIPWDKEKVYKYYAKMGWNKEMVDNNIFRKYSGSETNFTSFDRDSIMLYSIPEELTIGNYQVGWNTKLSNTDKKFISKMYPKSNAVNRELVGAGIPAADQ